MCDLGINAALKAKGLLGANDTTVQVLERVDLTNAQKHDEHFYPQDAVIVFNQKVRQANGGGSGGLATLLPTRTATRGLRNGVTLIPPNQES